MILLFTIITISLCAENDEIHPYLNKEFTIIWGFFNDNIPCTYDAATQGWSWGPDDQYSFGGTLKGAYQRFIFGVDYCGVTSREFLYRFDVIKITGLYSMPFAGIGYATYGGGLFFKGRVGGEKLQNWLHSNIGYPEVFLPYTENKFSANFRGGIAVTIYKQSNWGFLIQGYSDVEVYLLEGPNHAKVGIDIFYSRPHIDIEGIAGYNLYFLLPDYLDSILDNGIYLGLLATVKIASLATIGLGIGGFPVKNVTDDPNFIPKTYSYIPQVWILFGYGKKGLSIREFFVP